MNYIVLQLCCLDCKRFIELYVYSAKNYKELISIINEEIISKDEDDYDFAIYDEFGSFISYYRR